MCHPLDVGTLAKQAANAPPYSTKSAQEKETRRLPAQSCLQAGLEDLLAERRLHQLDGKFRRGIARIQNRIDLHYLE